MIRIRLGLIFLTTYFGVASGLFALDALIKDTRGNEYESVKILKYFPDGFLYEKEVPGWPSKRTKVLFTWFAPETAAELKKVATAGDESSRLAEQFMRAIESVKKVYLVQISSFDENGVNGYVTEADKTSPNSKEYYTPSNAAEIPAFIECKPDAKMVSGWKGYVELYPAGVTETLGYRKRKFTVFPESAIKYLQAEAAAN